MNMLRNFTIRFVMLTILGIFCLMWAGVGLYSTWSLSRVSEGNEVDRHLVKQMTVLSQGNDQYFPLRDPPEPRNGSQSRWRHARFVLRPTGAG